MRTYHQPSPVGAMALAGTATVVCVLPVFLTGALAVQLTDDLGFGAAGLGLAVALFRAAAAVFSPFLGRLADRLGATRSMRLSSLIAGSATLGIATTTSRWAHLAGWLTVSGVAQALSQPAANRLLANAVRPERLGAAFGVKQSAPPIGSMLAGLSVPVIALTLGWRWSFVIATAMAVAVAVAVGPAPAAVDRKPAPVLPGGVARKREILVLTLAFGLGTATSSALTTFYVDAVTRAGSTPSFAGTTFAIASVAAIVARLASGFGSDRMRSGHLKLCAGLLLGGSIGLILLGTGVPGLMAVGIFIALAGSWGFNGVFWFALIRSYPRAPGRITGAVAPGAMLGGSVGPIAFGLVAEYLDYSGAWWTFMAVSLAAAVMMAVGARYLPEPPPVR